VENVAEMYGGDLLDRAANVLAVEYVALVGRTMPPGERREIESDLASQLQELSSLMGD
jgi:hypothetical protein